MMNKYYRKMLHIILIIWSGMVLHQIVKLVPTPFCAVMAMLIFGFVVNDIVNTKEN